MEWSNRMNAAVDYIEENLAGEIDLKEAANMALCSNYHFQRVFYAVNGTTLGEYIRRRRLTLAAAELISDKIRIIDVASKYGYDSPSAFSKAFRNQHGVTPTEARKPGVTLTSYPRISFHIILKGGTDMDYRIIEKSGFIAAGKVRDFSTDVEQNMRDISQWWIEFGPSPAMGELVEFGGNKPGKVTEGMALGICFQKEGIDVWSYAIAVELLEGKEPGRYEIVEIPSSTWAIFETTLDDISVTWRRILDEWFPSSGYEHAGSPEMEVYLPGDMSGGSIHQIWVPVVKK